MRQAERVKQRYLARPTGPSRDDYLLQLEDVIAGVAETLESVQNGILDIGGYCFCFEPAKLFLHNFPYYAPFGPQDSAQQMKATRAVYDAVPWLTEQFKANNFNSQEIVRTICKSRTYQLSIESNEWNHDDTINYSHAKARRLPAEVLYDSIHLVTGAQSKFPGVPVGTRAAALPDVGVKLPDGFLGNLGRPARESACECERSNDLQLGPVMALVSGPTVGEALASGENSLSNLVSSIDNDEELFNELFMRILNRPANQQEIAAAIDTMSVMEEEHAVMSKRLAKLERLWKPREAELESKRWFERIPDESPSR